MDETLPRELRRVRAEAFGGGGLPRPIPSADVNLSFAALSTYLNNQKVCNLTVNSQIPFRKWPAT